MELELCGKYTKKEVHDILDPDTTFYYFCGKWGINGVVMYGGNNDKFAIFVTVGKEGSYHGRIQKLSKEGTLLWSTPIRKGTRASGIKRLLTAGRLHQSVSVFCRRNNDSSDDQEKLYTYIGKGIDPELIESENFPGMVLWKIEGIKPDRPEIKRLMD